MRAESYIKTIRALVAQDVLGRLEDIRVPTLVMNGEEDRLSPVAMAEDMAQTHSPRSISRHSWGRASVEPARTRKNSMKP